MFFNFLSKKFKVGIFCFRFPKNVERRRIWMSLLSNDETQAIPSQLEICSNHFQQSDFIHGLGGVKRLKRDAVPLPLHSQLDHMTSVRYLLYFYSYKQHFH